MGSLRFFLDENVLYEAHTGTNSRTGKEDYSAGILVLAIAEKCHKIVLDDEARRRYRSKLKALEDVRGQLAVNVSKVLSIMMSAGEKVYEPLSRRAKMPQGVPDDDKPLVELAIDAQATYVTADERLRARLAELSVLKNYDLAVVDAGTAASQAMHAS